MNKRNLIPRILVSPIILALLIVTYSISCILHFVRYIRYGGEWVSYNKEDRGSVDKIYKLLKEQYKN